MATSLVHDAKHEDWAEPRPSPGDHAPWMLWMLLGLASIALFGAFVLFVIDDYALRNLIAVN